MSTFLFALACILALGLVTSFATWLCDRSAKRQWERDKRER